MRRASGGQGSALDPLGPKGPRPQTDGVWGLSAPAEGPGRQRLPGRRRHLFLPIVLLATLADAPPALQPTHDVDITYKVPVAGGHDMAILQRFRYSASLRRQRVDLPTSGNWMVLDYVTHRMQAVRDESREVIDAPVPAEPPAAAGAGYRRLGTATVAGRLCTEWQTRDTNGQVTITCYTTDGLLLRARTNDRVLIEAISVSEAPQDPTIFTAPSHYTHTNGGP